MNCPKCGNEVSNGSAFCPDCGRKISSKKKRNIIILISCCIGIILLILLFNSKNSYIDKVKSYIEDYMISDASMGTHDFKLHGDIGIITTYSEEDSKSREYCIFNIEETQSFGSTDIWEVWYLNGEYFSVNVPYALPSTEELIKMSQEEQRDCTTAIYVNTAWDLYGENADTQEFIKESVRLDGEEIAAELGIPYEEKEEY